MNLEDGEDRPEPESGKQTALLTRAICRATGPCGRRSRTGGARLLSPRKRRRGTRRGRPCRRDPRPRVRRSRSRSLPRNPYLISPLQLCSFGATFLLRADTHFTLLALKWSALPPSFFPGGSFGLLLVAPFAFFCLLLGGGSRAIVSFGCRLVSSQN